MSDLNDDIRRGCLEDGQPIEARWGAGWWSYQRQEPELEYCQCPKCNGWAIETNFWEIYCEKCGVIDIRDLETDMSKIDKIGMNEVMALKVSGGANVAGHLITLIEEMIVDTIDMIDYEKVDEKQLDAIGELMYSLERSLKKVVYNAEGNHDPEKN